MSLQIVNNTPVLVRRPTSLDISSITGWGSPAGSCRDGADATNSWDWYNFGDEIDMRTIKQYITVNPNTVRLTVGFDYGTYVRYYLVNAAEYCPDYFPRTIIKYLQFETVSQLKFSDEKEVE